MNIKPDPSIPPEDQIEKLRRIAEEAAESSAIARSNIYSILGYVFSWIKVPSEELPDWAAQHIEITKKFEQAVYKFKKTEPFKQLPPDILKKLSESKETVGKIANHVNYTAFLKAILPQEVGLDPYNLLSGQSGRKLVQSETEWHLNLGLLMNVFNQTQDPKLKKQIEFLALNYLAKAAPISLQELGVDPQTTERMESMFQLGVFEEGFYHREVGVFDSHISESLDELFAKPPFKDPVVIERSFLTDTIDMKDLFPLIYRVMQIPEKGSDQIAIDHVSKQLSDSIIDHLRSNSTEGFEKYMHQALLVDLTDIIGDTIKTEGDPQKEVLFKKRAAEIEGVFEKAIEKAIARLKQYDPSFVKTAEDKQKLMVFFKAHLNFIVRSEVNEVGVLRTISLFMDPKNYELPKNTDSFLGYDRKEKKIESEEFTKNIPYMIRGGKIQRQNQDLLAFLNFTGLRLGGVSGREKIFNFMSLPQFLTSIGSPKKIVDYSVEGENVAAFKKKTDPTMTALFKRMKKNMHDPKLMRENPQIAILGKATIDLIEGLLKEIDSKKWNGLNQNPDTRMLIQTSLFRVLQLLASADLKRENFTGFAQSMELVQSELTTLLALTSPFKEGDFQEIYKNRLTIVPKKLENFVKAGVAKSAMNVFAGINAIVRQMNPSFQRAYSAGAYFEEISLVGESRSVNDLVADKNIHAVDLYLGEFSHNIDIHLSTDHYSLSNVKDEIKTLLQEKDQTQYLTVAIDSTIDFINSEKVKELLETFSQGILSGKLNFIFFRSGQKFDMLGLDNYYGATFWMVNNGDKQWQGFNQLLTKDTYRTDNLSRQWFSLVNKYAPQSLDDYRARIFKNTREILDQIPKEYNRGGAISNRVRISTVDNEMDPVFIDIKILHPKSGTIESLLRKRLVKRFADHQAKLQARASFGFYHANWNMIRASYDDNNPRNLRINPGLDPNENQIILDFINEDIPAVLKEIDQSS